VATPLLDVFKCFSIKENCINFFMMIVCSFGHQQLDDPHVDFNLLGFCGRKVPPQLGDIPCPLYVAQCHDTSIYILNVRLDAGVINIQ
jgi:hypothetical protein